MNSTVKIALSFLFILLIGCKEKEITVPKNLIAEGEFVDIMVELSLIEATRSLHSTKEHKTDTHPTIFYRQLWEGHSISKEQFEHSFSHYRLDLDQMAEIYEKVALILKRKEDDINAAKRALKKEEGSTSPQISEE